MFVFATAGDGNELHLYERKANRWVQLNPGGWTTGNVVGSANTMYVFASGGVFGGNDSHRFELAEAVLCSCAVLRRWLVGCRVLRALCSGYACPGLCLEACGRVYNWIIHLRLLRPAGES